MKKIDLFISISMIAFVFSFATGQTIQNDTIFVHKSVHFKEQVIDTIIVMINNRRLGEIVND